MFKNLKQFENWFLDNINDEILEKVFNLSKKRLSKTMKDVNPNISNIQKRHILKARLTTSHFKKMLVEIYLDTKNEFSKTIMNIERPTIRENIDEFIEKHGIVTVVVSMICIRDFDEHTTEFLLNYLEGKEEQLISSLNSVTDKKKKHNISHSIIEASEVNISEEEIATVSESPSISNSLSINSIVQQVERFIEAEVSNLKIEDIEFLNEFFKKASEKLTEIKNDKEKKEEIINEINNLLSVIQSNDSISTLTYLQEESLSTCTIDTLNDLTLNDLELMKGVLSELNSLINETNDLRSKMVYSYEKNVFDTIGLLKNKISKLMKEYHLIFLKEVKVENETDSIGNVNISDQDIPESNKSILIDEKDIEISDIKSFDETNYFTPSYDDRGEGGSKEELIHPKETAIKNLNDLNDEVYLLGDKGVLEKNNGLEAEKEKSSNLKIDQVNNLFNSENQTVSKDKETNYQSIICNFIENNELNYLYWISRELEDSLLVANSNIIPSWLTLISIICLSSLNIDNEEIEIIYNIINAHPDPIKEVCSTSSIQPEYVALLCAAISFKLSILAPECDSMNWIETSCSYLGHLNDSNFYMLFNKVFNFLKSGAQYGMLDSLRILSSKRWDDIANEFSIELINWLDDVQAKRTPYIPANNFIKSFTDKENAIYDVILIIRNNDFNQLGIVEEFLKDTLTDNKAIQNYIKFRINDILYKHNSLNKARPIEGIVLDLLTRKLSEFKNISEKWASIVRIGRTYDKSPENNRNIKLVKDFTDDVLKIKREINVKKYLEELSSSCNKGIVNPAIYKLGIRIVDEVFEGLSDYNISKSSIFSGIRLNSSSLPFWKRYLSYPLLFVDYPDIKQNWDIDIKEFNYSYGKFVYAFSNNCSLIDRFEKHLENHDYVCANLCISFLSEGNEDISSYSLKLKNHETEARISFKKQHEEISAQILLAFLDHMITEDEYSILHNEISSVDIALLEKAYISFEKLSSIRETLLKMKEKRRIALGNDIFEIEKKVSDVAQTMDDSAYHAISRYIEKAREALDNNEFGIVDEYISFAEQGLKGEIKEDIRKKSAISNYVVEYFSIHNDLYEVLDEEKDTLSNITRSIEINNKNLKIAKILNLSRVPASHIKGIQAGIDAWINLKKFYKAERDYQYNLNLISVLEFIGFSVSISDFEFRKYEINDAYFSFKSSSGSLSPLPEFGSERNDRYDLIIVHPRPGSSTLGEIIEKYGLYNGCPVILYLGKLSDKQLTDWIKYCRKNKHTSMLIDEVLMYYLTSINDSRITAAISCGASLSDIMPYRSFGMIPKEIFKGREEMIASIGRPDGSCFVFGGRQFGKSVMLHMVEQRYGNAKNGIFVIYDDIKTIGDPKGIRHKNEIWRLLNERLISYGIIPKANNVLIDSTEVSQQIINYLNNNAESRIILLLDESDNFLDADSATNFSEVAQLRRIMDNTGRRFKVVFCGLHNVLRHSSYINHPFAQMMASPLNVGPLEPEAAYELIIEPMSSIGYDFSGEESQNALLKILSYTNYHPALIQHICFALISKTRKYQLPPYRINVSDVEAIYRKDDIRDFVKERFNWTLGLDTRYEVIVYSMVNSQLSDNGGYRKEFTANDLLVLARDHWYEGFEKVNLEDFKTILSELIGLGVLIKISDNGTYRLKNANIVRALGTGIEIDERLNQIALNPAPAKYDDVEYMRVELDENMVSSLTYKQLSTIVNDSMSGVSLVFGSTASGIDYVLNTLRYAKSKDSSGYFEDCSNRISSIQRLQGYIEKLIKDEKSKHRILYFDLSKCDENKVEFTTLIKKVNEFICKTCLNSIIKAVFVFNANSTFKWFHENSKIDENIESCVNSVIILKKWNSKAIQRFLTDSNKACVDSTAEQIHNVTGGWMILVQRYMEMIKKNSVNVEPNLKAIAEQLNELISSSKDLKSVFIEALGLNNKAYINILKLISQFEPISTIEILEFVKEEKEYDTELSGNYPVQVVLSALERLQILDGNPSAFTCDTKALGMVVGSD